jgi:hypothetical protein
MSSYTSTGKKYLEALRQYLIDKEFTDYGGAEGNVYNRNNDHKKIFVA